ncbi:SusD/RagB family nutrient-binding outer membrane lipoprotein [Riemerella anatipestifer]|nr:SusD/RagB family nutrient-binding outer membrane lipoprotein [Riemerella anatipestifer]MDY3533814.1 SusD/RagB family nutrient-binding outer membrane lipoprotein [Riemerella anatipestifer]MDY3535898.1 SusD/RagB family nutrient-binding outer membrane lipoprotein [Riemerella anatipestifer]
MKKILYNLTILSSLSAVTILTSCRQDFEEINKNPNNPSQAPTSAVLNSAVKELMDATRGAFSSGRFFLPWMQYSAQTNYTEEDRYRFRENVNQSLYRDYYLVAKDFKFIIDLNTNPETANTVSAYGINQNQVAMSRIMLSYIFSQLVDTYGDVPYYSYGSKDSDFQALDVLKYPNPKFASQQKIYADILKELKEASEMMDTSKPVFVSSHASGDRIFSGDSKKWKKFANSLRLRIANRVKGVVSGAEAHITDAIASGVMTSNADNATLTYQSDPTYAAPLYTAFVVDAREDFHVSDTFIKALKGEKGNFGVDPRLQQMAAPKGTSVDLTSTNGYTPSSDINNYVGMPYGVASESAPQQAENGKTSIFGYNVMRPDATLTFMEYAEVEFLLSEVNGWNRTHYEKGVRASMENWGVSTSDIDSFVSNLPAPNQENVITQKYIALYMQPVEAWSEYRRTGYPNFLLKPGQTNKYLAPDKDGNMTYTFESLVAGLTDVPYRVTYPTNLATLNPENYKAAQTTVGGDKLTTKLIWDKN